MATVDKGGTVTLQELLVTSLAQTDALSKLLIEKGVFTQEEFMEKIKGERATYQAIFQKVIHYGAINHLLVSLYLCLRLRFTLLLISFSRLSTSNRVFLAYLRRILPAGVGSIPRPLTL